MNMSIMEALVLVLLAMLASVGESKDVVNRIKKDNDDWDYLRFAQEWPQSSCEYQKATGGHQCSIPSGVKGFTIHGIWPTKFKGRSPDYCDRKHPFDESQIKDLEPQLRNQWPNLYTDETKTRFWEHEWEKHGTCAENLDALKGEHNFFKAGLYFNVKFDIRSALAKSDIIPSSDGYQVDDIANALHKEYKHNVCVGCRYHEDLGQLYMNTVVCLNKNLGIIDCPRCWNPCHSSEPVVYHPLHYGQK